MVKFTTSIIALAMAASVAAAPAPTSQTTFSFAQWVEDIIANPDTALTPEEAVAAAQSAAVVTSAGGLSKRAWCQDALKSAPAGDATACLNDLARKGAQGITCTVGQGQSSVQMCQIGGAKIVSSKPDQPAQGANCNDVARTGGLIFDSCYRADNTVKGSDVCITNNKFQVAIAGV
ncbi:hypothetical protein CkaCkLH20_00828 [Colletotrichum karsti]|uniref:Secreted protein n=1 Tax=Colletotrichum karsti TaxID=1095194 RepID=A0A9P6IE17_9PEZI|nr:uncharacterized protein CkaCkLH20_00828 [Colletotrichum karsti]KAF9881682.1 hypothetical protein CkaCkLH20_00828 [Colletotrichum karsti]